MGRTMTIELRDEDYDWLLGEAQRTGVTPEQVEAMRLARSAAADEREQDSYRSGVASGLFVAPCGPAPAARQPVRSRPVPGQPLSETIVEERR